jgi:cytochrome c556
MNLTAKLAAGVALAVIAGYVGTSLVGHESAAATVSRLQLAAADPAAIIKERQDLMKGQGKEAKAIADFLESNTGTAEDVAKNAAAIKLSSGKIVELFPAGTSINDGVGKTGAKPEIWQDMDGFKAAAGKLGELAGALETAAAGGDKEQIAAAFGTLGKEGCGGCHTKFRQKLD